METGCVFFAVGTVSLCVVILFRRALASEGPYAGHHTSETLPERFANEQTGVLMYAEECSPFTVH
jgi:hypothetical protein